MNDSKDGCSIEGKKTRNSNETFSRYSSYFYLPAEVKKMQKKNAQVGEFLSVHTLPVRSVRLFALHC
jgi:hypothetical protein